jgi:hypothetical protein
MRIASDDERLRPQRRVLELLDRGEEGIKVEVRDDHASRLLSGSARQTPRRV